jgi:hypothetical protein
MYRVAVRRVFLRKRRFYTVQKVRDLLLKLVFFFNFFNIDTEVQTQGPKHTRMEIFSPNSVL